MRRRVLLLTEIIAPYRIPVFNLLAQDPAIDLHVVFLSETDPSLRHWRIYSDDIRFQYRVLSCWRQRIAGYNLLVNWGLCRELDRVRPQVLICGGYNYLASWQASHWCRRHDVPLILWAESTAHDRRRKFPFVESFKKRFLRACAACVVPGRSSREYFSGFDFPTAAIVTAPDAVDNELFSQLAVNARAHDAAYRERYGLPRRYFLYVGRMVAEKGVFDLVDAYASLSPELRSEVGLVFAGNGKAYDEVKRQAKRITPGRIQTSGFVHREDLPVYYALADLLVFPTHTDPWGLVVNEAMACGLPVITTSVPGCAADLVENGVNGFVFFPGDVSQLASSMEFLARQDEIREQFGARSIEKIRSNSPQACAQGLSAAAFLPAAGGALG